MKALMLMCIYEVTAEHKERLIHTDAIQFRSQMVPTPYAFIHHCVHG